MNSSIQPFSEVLRKFRERMTPKISQQKLADALQVNRQTVVAWELGDSLPKDRTRILEIAKYLSLDDEETNELLLAALLDPLPPFNIPYDRNSFFSGREEILQHLHHALVSGTVVAVTQPQAISGLGGIGKTQIALEYAYRYRQDYQAALWLQADSKEILSSEIVRLVLTLALPEQDELDYTRMVSAIKRWLKVHKEWLLIFDNIEDLTLLKEVLPPGHHGHVLLTTRAAVTEPIAYANELEKMMEQEGVFFLLRRAKILPLDVTVESAQEEDHAQAQRIWELMDGHPLALDQAGAYILETRCGLSDYLSLYQKNQSFLLKRRGSLETDYPHSVLTTWSLSFNKIKYLDPIAADLLYLLAFLAPDEVPVELIIEGCSLLGPDFEALGQNLIRFNDAIEIILRYSLIKRNSGNNSISIHRLVQVALRDDMDSSLQKQWVERAIRMTSEVLSFKAVAVNSTQLCEQLLPHAYACVNHSKEWNLSSLEIAKLLGYMAYYLSDRSRFKEAELLYLQAIQVGKQVLGETHVDIAGCMSNLARIYAMQNRYEQAEQVWLEALSIDSQSSGSNVPLILRNLMELDMDREQYSEAQLNDPLDVFEQVLGSEHDTTKSVKRAKEAAKIKEASFKPIEPVIQTIIKFYEENKETNSLDYIHSLHLLVLLYMKQKRYLEAETLCLQMIQTMEQVSTIAPSEWTRVWSALANVYFKQKQYAEAELFYQKAISNEEETLNPDETALVTLYNNLAMLYGHQGKYSEAILLSQHAIEVGEKLFGAEHTSVADSLSILADQHGIQGSHKLAEPLYLRAYQIYNHLLGFGHSQTKNAWLKYIFNQRLGASSSSST